MQSIAPPLISLTETDDGSVRDDQYLIFRLCGKRYGMLLHWVREILRDQPIPIPFSGVSDFLGVVRMRDESIPAMDLALRFALRKAPSVPINWFLVVRAVLANGRQTRIAFCVDEIDEVLAIPPGRIDAASGGQWPIRKEFFIGVAHVPHDSIPILNFELILRTMAIDLIVNGTESLLLNDLTFLQPTLRA
jgi:purine-binding chemotaxis protein CheW